MANGNSKDHREHSWTPVPSQSEDLEKAFNRKSPIYEHYESAPLPRPRPKPGPPKDDGGKK